MIQASVFQRAHLETLKKALGVYAQRHRVTAENIANVETPDFKAKEYRFEELLRGATAGGRLSGAQTDPHHLPVGRRGPEQVQGQIVEEQTGLDNGVNDVDIDREMASLATTDLSYRLATRVLSMKYRLLREAVTGQIR